MSAERERVAGFGRLEDGLRQASEWYRWGPYLSERQWGTVREDYSPDGDAWNYLPHDHARSRAYRWGEDGLAGFCDVEQRLCLALALWNGRDPILKERAFGLTGSQVWISEAVADGQDRIDLADMAVIHGPRQASQGTYDAWRAVFRARKPRFEFTDPQLWHSVSMMLAFASAAAQPTAVLTGPMSPCDGPDDTHGMVRVGLNRRPLTAEAAVAWSGDLPRLLQQVLFDAADYPPGVTREAS